MGTWQTFDVGTGADERAPLVEVLRALFAAGGKVIDSSPMYGRAESVVGDLLAAEKLTSKAFLATKVWVSGRDEGVAQMERSLARLRVERLDLMQVHNLLDYRTQIETLRRWKQEGRVHYIGVTHYQLGAFAELERIVREDGVDVVQLPYSVAMRDAETRLLPAAAESGVAVLVMRPFQGGDLFDRVRGRELPPVAAELGATSWAQLMLKWILGHPAVTCPIPASSKARHMIDNLQAGRGAVPDQAQRAAILKALGV
jgi:aryl-alcohol dehydrogenase-like predicted oxidoreductase